MFSLTRVGSIGNANIQGMSETLGLVGQQYNWWVLSYLLYSASTSIETNIYYGNRCLTIFFFPYSFTEPLCNLLLVRLKPSIWLPSIMVAWGTGFLFFYDWNIQFVANALTGIVMTLTGIVQNYSGLLAARFFLGRIVPSNQKLESLTSFSTTL